MSGEHYPEPQPESAPGESSEGLGGDEGDVSEMSDEELEFIDRLAYSEVRMIGGVETRVYLAPIGHPTVTPKLAGMKEAMEPVREYVRSQKPLIERLRQEAKASRRLQGSR
jgi:hypothetical protein